MHQTLWCDDQVPLALLALQGHATHTGIHATTCAHSSLLDSCLIFGKPWRDAPLSTYPTTPSVTKAGLL